MSLEIKEYEYLDPMDVFKKDNSLITMLSAKTQMGVNQQRFFNSLIANIQHMNTKKKLIIEEEGELTLKWNDVFKSMQRSTGVKRLRRDQIKDSIERLVNIQYTWDIKNSERDEVGAFVLFQKCVVDFKKDEIRIVFGKDFRVNTLLPTVRYTIFSQYDTKNLKSSYSRTLYELFRCKIGAKPNRPFQKFSYYEIDELIHLLVGKVSETSTYAKNYSLFIKNCIEGPVEEINDNSDINIIATIIKSGRFIQKIRFDFKYVGEVLEDYVDGDSEEDNEDEKKSIVYKENKNQKTLPGFLVEETDDSRKKKIFDFRQQMIEKYKNKAIVTGLVELGFSEIVTFIINKKGFLQSDLFTGKDVNAESAIKIWEYLFDNQHRIGDIKEISSSEKLEYMYKDQRIDISHKTSNNDYAIIKRFVQNTKTKVSMVVFYNDQEMLYKIGEENSYTELQIIKEIESRRTSTPILS